MLLRRCPVPDIQSWSADPVVLRDVCLFFRRRWDRRRQQRDRSHEPDHRHCDSGRQRQGGRAEGHDGQDDSQRLEHRPAPDAPKAFIRLLAKFATLASSPRHRPSAPDARGSGPSQSAGAPRQTGSAPVARCTPSRVRRRAPSQVALAAAVPARIAWCPDNLRACRVCGRPSRMPYAPPMSQLCFPDSTAPTSLPAGYHVRVRTSL